METEAEALISELIVFHYSERKDDKLNSSKVRTKKLKVSTEVRNASTKFCKLFWIAIKKTFYIYVVNNIHSVDQLVIVKEIVK